MRTVTAIGFAFIVLAAAGCRRPEQAVTRVQFSFWGSVQQQATEVAIIADFERLNPDIKIETLRIGSRYPEKLQSMLVGRVAPDVMMVDVHAYYDWAARGVLADLTEDMAEISRGQTIMPVPAHAAHYRGKAFALPVNVAGYGLFYNKAVLRAAEIELPAGGPTWAWIESIAPKLARRLGNAQAPCDYVMVSPEALALASAFGARLFDDPANPHQVTVNSPQMADAMKYLRRNVSSGAMLARPEINDPGNPKAQLGLWRQQRVAFHLAGRYEVPNVMGQTEFEWGVWPLPAGPGGRVGPHGGTLITVSAQTEHPEAARRFARYYASRRGAETAMPGGRIVPVFAEVAYGAEFAALLPGIDSRVFADTMKEGASTFYNYTPGVATTRKIFEDRFEQVTAEPEASIDAILATMQIELERWMQRSRERGQL